MTHSLAVALSLVVALVAPPARDSARARALRWSALNQRAALNLDSALALVQAARRADPGYFPAQWDYIDLRHIRYEEAALRREAVALIRSADPAERCEGIAMRAFTEERSSYPELRALEGSGGATVCSAVYLAVTPRRTDDSDSLRRARYARAIGATPELEVTWEEYAGFLKNKALWNDAERVLERGQAAVRHPFVRASIAMVQVGLRLARGDTAGALALRRSVRVAIQRDARPGLRAAYEDNPCGRHPWADVGEDQDLAQRSAVNAPRVTGDWAWVARTLIGCAHALMDRGQPLESLPYLSRVILIADSVQRPDLFLEVYIQRARAYSRLGRHDDAEQDLLRALDLGQGAGRLYNVADAYNNLGQLYEGAGRWPEADRAITRFVGLARSMDGGLRFASLLEAAELRWKAGWHASARVAFDEMVRVSDELNVEHYWSGEYYERVGDLRRARQYYEKARSDYGWNSRAQSGLSRVYDALGQPDSAEAIARIHDSQEAVWPPLEVPLMPGILSRRGRGTEAVALMGAWASRQEQRGNLHGASLAFLQLSRVALDARDGKTALASAQRAESLAARLHLMGERIRAIMMRGLALEQLGPGDSALRVLRAAARLAPADSTADILFDSHLALGDAYARRGQVDPALVAYDRAAQVAERVTRSLVQDLDRARYRDRHLLPFDGAVKALVLGEPSPPRLEQLIAWSARRKAAALSLATNDATRRIETARDSVSLGRLQGVLRGDEAMLDYLVLDSVVAAIVVTRVGASLHRLPIGVDSVRLMVERLRRPFVTVYGRRLDLARARFDLRTAADLHAALVQPLASVLAGKHRLMIVPDGPLHALPFEALVLSSNALPAGRGTLDYAHANYLIDEFQVDYLPSSAVLSNGPPRGSDPLTGSRLLVVAYGAPGGEQEASAVRAAWPAGQTTVFEEAAATERAVKAGMARFGVIHFAVHARSSVRDPLASHLRLAPDPLEDGYLHLDEIAAAKLGARLVVLSACETDAGPIYNGEGVMGLARAFLASGAHAVVGTQWPIGPATATLMSDFYKGLARGKSVSRALREAKVAMRSTPSTAHPFYWAGLVLVASGRER